VFLLNIFYFICKTLLNNCTTHVAKYCWNKGVSQVTYWVLTITRYQNNQLDMLNNLFKCAGSIIKVLFLEILIEQVQEQRIYLKLKASGRLHLKNCVWSAASEELRLKKRVWRRAPEDTSSEALVIRSTEHQKHISPEATSPELTKDSVRSVRPRTLQPPPLQYLSLQQDKDNSNIATEVVPFVLEWIWIKFLIGQVSNQAKDQGWRIKASRRTSWCNG